jgi:ankyrin repeat protein
MTETTSDQQELSALPTAAQVFEAVQKDDVEALQQISQVFAENDKLDVLRSFRTKDLDCLPLLSFAIVSKSKKCFYFLLQSKDEISSPFLLDEANWNSLTHAVESGNPEAVRAILDVVNNMNHHNNENDYLSKLVNQRTSEDWFPLTYAIVSGNIEIVKMLLQVPCLDVTSTVDEMSHKEIAEKRKYLDIVKMLEEKEEEVNKNAKK